MRRTFHFTCLILALIFVCAPLAANESSKLQRIKSKIHELRAQLSSKQTQRDHLQAELNISDRAINNLQSSINQVIQDRNEINDNITALENRQIELLDEKRDLQSALMQQLVAAYKTGKQSKIKMLLSQKNPENIGRLLSYHNYLNIAREEQITNLQNTIESLKELAEDIQKQTWQLSINEEKLNREKKLLADEKANKAKLLRKLNSDISTKTKNITRLSKDQQKLEQLIADIAKRKEEIIQASTISNASGFANNKGRMNRPVQGNITHDFNSIIAGDVRRAGIFISAKEGSPVTAVYGGTIVYADWFQKKGLMTIISHGNGYMSLYAHNQSLLNKEGDTVRAGEKIALSGQSGNIDSPGVYFEIRQNGKALNPRQWLRP